MKLLISKKRLSNNQEGNTDNPNIQILCWSRYILGKQNVNWGLYFIRSSGRHNITKVFCIPNSISVHNRKPISWLPGVYKRQEASFSMVFINVLPSVNCTTALYEHISFLSQWKLTLSLTKSLSFDYALLRVSDSPYHSEGDNTNIYSSHTYK